MSNEHLICIDLTHENGGSDFPTYSFIPKRFIDMVTKTRLRAGVCLGFVGGLSLALALPAQAQIAVQGGRITGDAGFFIPNQGAAGNVTLFDAAVRSLRLVTPNGVTNTALFTPQAASFNSPSGAPSSGDTGVLQGTWQGLPMVPPALVRSLFLVGRPRSTSPSRVLMLGLADCWVVC